MSKIRTTKPSEQAQNDREVDAIISRSKIWQIIQEALAAALAPHPEAARDVAKALRGVSL